MKKLCALCVTLSLLVGLTACGSPAAITVTHGSYSCTPQELIDIINKGVAASDPDGLLEIPDYYMSGNEIYIYNKKLTLTLHADGSGSLCKIRLYWDPSDSSASSAGFYTSVIVSALNPATSDDIVEKISQAVSESGSFTTVEGENKYVFYSAWDGRQELIISPAPTPS